jgi:hypothetical protein
MTPSRIGIAAQHIQRTTSLTGTANLFFTNPQGPHQRDSSSASVDATDSFTQPLIASISA